MLTKTIEGHPILQYLAKCQPRQYRNGVAQMSRVLFQHSCSVADISCSYHKIKLILKQEGTNVPD